MPTPSELAVGVHNLGYRGWLAVRHGARLGARRWYWRLGYALWLESLRGPAHRPGQRFPPPPGFAEQDFIYGETPLGTAQQLLEWAQLQPGQRFCEIGCGRCVVGLVAHLVFGAQVEAFEMVAELADKARWLVRALSVETGVRIHQQGSIPAADLYFLTPTTWGADNWARVNDALAQAPAGSKALVLSQPLPGWKVLERRSLAFSWGFCGTYLQGKD